MSFLRRFTYGKAQAKSASNTYSEVKLFNFTLAELYNNKNMKYDTAFQLFHLKRDNRCIFTLQDIEQKFLTIDEKTTSLSQLAIGSSAQTHHNNNSCYKRGKSRSDSCSTSQSWGKQGGDNEKHPAAAHAVSSLQLPSYYLL